MGKCIMPQVFVIGGGDEDIGTGDYLVRYIDYDGTILKEKRVDSGGSVTPPTAPTHEGLTFDEWTATSTNVTSNLDIRAVYYTTDGKTLFGLRSTVATGKDVVLYLNKSDGSTLTIDWGDGSSNDFTNTSYFNTGIHTYANYGDYDVKMWISEGIGTYGFGDGSGSITVVGGSTQTQRDMLLYAFVGDSVVSIIGYAFQNCYSLTNVTIPSGIMSIGANAFYKCYSLTSITIPNSVANISAASFRYCYSLTNITIQNSVISVSNFAFSDCFSLTSITIPNSVTSVGTNAFANCLSLKTYVFERTAGITALGATNTFTGINSATKIYVPDDLVDDYKIAANWTTYADYIYPISEKGVTHND